MKQNHKLTGRRILAAVAMAATASWGGLVLAPAASADSAVASVTTSSTAPSTTVRPYTGSECTAMLQAWGYPVTTTRGTICFVAASPVGNPVVKYVACTFGLKATGVGILAANAACQVAVFSGA